MLTEQDSNRKANLALLASKRALIATGTDAGNIGTLHASSYYEELEEMAAGGMSNAQILKASTLTAAQIMGKEKELGSIEKGKWADLLILDQNPLDSLKSLKTLRYVIKGGKLWEAESILSSSPEQVVQQQLNAYNARNIEAFMACYSPEAKVFSHPHQPMMKDPEQMRQIYSAIFESTPNLHCELINRMVLSNTVIDQERVTGFENGNIVEAIAIYKVKHGKIASVHFINGD